MYVCTDNNMDTKDEKRGYYVHAGVLSQNDILETRKGGCSGNSARACFLLHPRRSAIIVELGPLEECTAGVPIWRQRWMKEDGGELPLFPGRVAHMTHPHVSAPILLLALHAAKDGGDVASAPRRLPAHNQ